MSRPEPVKIYVGNLSWNTTDDMLVDAFTQFGNILDAVVMRDRDTGRSRGFGFVTYAKSDEAHEAIRQMNDKELDGRKLKVNLANARSGRPDAYQMYNAPGYAASPYHDYSQNPYGGNYVSNVPPNVANVGPNVGPNVVPSAGYGGYASYNPGFDPGYQQAHPFGGQQPHAGAGYPYPPQSRY
jgi:RNA recognition motif-containing protein